MDAVDPILALRAFVPARDFDLSCRFYEALGFVHDPSGVLWHVAEVSF